MSLSQRVDLKRWYIYTVELEKKNDTVKFVGKWMKPASIL